MAITESQFHMWRAVFAIVHIDNVVTPEEVRFMAEALEDIPFSPVQKAVLQEDTRTPQSVSEMFEGITEPVDQMEFFRIARKLAHIDGDFDAAEQKILTHLQERHIGDTNVDDLVGSVSLELEEDTQISDTNGRDVEGDLMSFRDRFLKTIGLKD